MISSKQKPIKKTLTAIFEHTQNRTMKNFGYLNLDTYTQQKNEQLEIILKQNFFPIALSRIF